MTDEVSQEAVSVEDRNKATRDFYSRFPFRNEIEDLAEELGMSVIGRFYDELGQTNYWIVPKGVQYSIYLHKRPNKDTDYMGAGFTVEPISGETWRRGNDLPDGDLSQETWDNIKNRIVELHKELKAQGKA